MCFKANILMHFSLCVLTCLCMADTHISLSKILARFFEELTQVTNDYKFKTLASRLHTYHVSREKHVLVVVFVIAKVSIANNLVFAESQMISHRQQRD